MRWTVITNCDSFFITKCDTVYYKLRQVLQSAINLLQIATGITKCDDYYKLRQYIRANVRIIQIRDLIDLSTSLTLGNRLVSTGFQIQLACFRKSKRSWDKTSAKYPNRLVFVLNPELVLKSSKR